MIVSIISILVLFSVIILVHETGHFLAAKRVGIKVEKFSLGFGPKIFSFKRGDTVYQLSLLPFGGFVKLAGEEDSIEKDVYNDWEYIGKSPGHRSQVIVAGSLGNLILAFLLLVPVFIIGVPGYDGTKIGSFVEGLPAETSGLKVEDEVLEVNGIECKEWFDVLINIRKAIDKSHTTPVELTIRRGMDIQKIKVMPALYREGDKDIYILGISPMEKIERYGPGRAVIRATKEFVNMLHGVFIAIKMLITRQASPKQLSGPIGIAQWGADIARRGTSRFLYYIAFISVNLGIVNLLPFPVLDGGHLVGLAGERIIRRRPSKKFLEWAGYIGFVLIICLALYVTYNDILRVLGERVIKR
ncbi:MAG: site-2 protease family protein [Candidatus Omnitrophica bacterium]|nr:site-2 protease family protein [Candidatus Omnitrophota bacterium]MCM8777681.1 site-2 protease family protein [Candidatus Omnitrophota bacterium]